MGDKVEESREPSRTLVVAGEHVDRLLAASSRDQAVELAAELVLAVTGAGGVQVLAPDRDALVELWSAGGLEGDESERQAMAATALELGRAVFGEAVSAVPIRSGGFAAAVVVEGGCGLDPSLAALLSSLGSRGVEIAELRREVEAQRRLRLNLSRYVSPPVAIAIGRAGGQPLEGPEQRAVSILVVTVDGLATEVDLIGPERVLPVLHAYFSNVADAVYEREGVLLEVGLERVVAVFGSPIRSDDTTQADLAASAGLRLLDGLQSMAERSGLEGLPVHIHVRAGVSSGSAMVGSFGSA